MTGPVMWPTRLPAEVRNSRYRQAEVRVYDRLSAQLPAGWSVFYSRPWLGLAPDGTERDGECDFFLAHPGKGLLAIEVKGGEISYDPESEEWRSRDRDGIRHIISNPIEQARRAKHELLRKLQQTRGWDSRKFLRIAHGVIFPDAVAPPANLGADRPREIFCSRPQLGKLAEWVESRLSHGNGEGPGHDGMRALEKLLAEPFTLRMPLGAVLDQDEAEIAALTPQQYRILDAVSGLSRIAAGGAAGTGKTIVAVEDAVRCADKGLRTALICAGSPLADELRRKLSETEVTVMSFGEFCTAMASQGGISVEVGDEGDLPDDCVEALAKAAELRPDLRFDAIIVDEAQDFRSHWWVALDGWTVPGTGLLHVFYDTNQSLYGPVGAQLAAFDLLPIRFERNLRNTKAIHGTATLHYRGPDVFADGPDGVPVETIRCASDAIAKTVADVVRKLVLHESISPADIAVLAPDRSLISAIHAQLDRSGTRVGIVDSIARFKGLERSVVIVAADTSISDVVELAYVALSRARTHLILVGEDRIMEWLKDPSARQA